MNECLKVKKTNCKNCYKCIRYCPVKSIRFSSGHANINYKDCILCGQCFIYCPQNANEIRNDIGVAKKLIEDGYEVYASLAPSFVANYDGKTISSLKKALLQLGFHDVQETAIGATIVKNKYAEMINSGEHNIIISSCCPSVNMLIQKYYPEALDYLAKVMSPMQAHCSLIKSNNINAKTVFIGPCISKKAEADESPETVDCVLTFEELSEWLFMEGIKLEDVEDDNLDSGKTRMFPTNGGILNTMDCTNPDFDYIIIDGVSNCMSALEDIIRGGISNTFIEMSSCSGSCLGGPVMKKAHASPVRDYLLVKNYSSANDFDIKLPSNFGFDKIIKPLNIASYPPDEEQITEILHKLGKYNSEQELNCGTCGYNSCREKAIAVLKGKADLTMCLPYLKEKAESFSENIIRNSPNGIIVVNEGFEIHQINKSARIILNIDNDVNVIGEHIIRVLDPTIFFDVLKTGREVKDKKVYFPDCDKYIEQSVIFDRSNKLLICILRDVTEQEIVRIKKDKMSKQTINIVNNVIENQMRAVQEIALLLGETAAETKIAITNLKESLIDE